MYACMYVYARMYACTYVRVRVHKYMCIYVYICVRNYIIIYVCTEELHVYGCAYVYIYTYMYMRTRLHDQCQHAVSGPKNWRWKIEDGKIEDGNVFSSDASRATGTVRRDG